MPPKDDQQRIELQQQQQQQQSTATSSPTSAASFFFHVQSSDSQGAAQPEDPSQPQTQQTQYLELETSSPTTTTAPIESIKLPSFRLLPRQPSFESSSSPQEVPAFLAFLNQLHGGDATSSSQEELSNDEPSSTATQFGSSITSSSASSSIAPVERRVHFAEAAPQIHFTLSRQDYSSHERNNTWYTDRYLRISSQMHATDNDADDEDVAHKAGHKRDLILAAARIRRARQAVMKEQARTPYLSPGAKRRKEERIREAYHRATLQCQRDAKGRGDAAAARVWEC